MKSLQRTGVNSNKAISVQIQVCTNRTCKRQGSQQVQKFLEDVAHPSVEVEACGCLGSCGMGPNMVINYQSAPVLLHHVSTPNDAAEALKLVCGIEISKADVAAVQARIQGNELAYSGQLEAAVTQYTKGLSFKPSGGQHLLLCNRSAALLQLGRKQESLDDALESLKLAPPGYAMAWIRAIDSYYALGLYKEAAETTERAFKENAQFKNLPEFKAVIKALQKAGQSIR